MLRTPTPGSNARPGGINFLGVGIARALLTPGLALEYWGWGGGRGLEEHVPWGPRTCLKRAQSPASVLLPTIFDHHSIFSLSSVGYASVSAGGSGSGLNPAGWQSGSRSTRTCRARPLGDTGLRLLLFGVEHPRAPFSFSGLGDPGSPRPTQPTSESFLCSQTALPRGRLFPGMPPISRFHFRSQVCSASLFGTWEASGTRVSECPLRPRLPLGRAGTSVRLWLRLLFQVR